MKFKFTLQKESLDLLNKLLRSVSKFWANQRLFVYCDITGITLYPESITEASLTYCEITFLSPERTILPKVDGGVECKQFFESYLISSEKPNSRILFAPTSFTDFAKAISLLSSLKLESAATFKLSQEVVNNYITVRVYFLI